MPATIPRPFFGRRVMVTGAAAGIGRAVADALAEKGARLVLADRDVGGLEKARAALAERGAEVATVALDVTDAATIGPSVAAAVVLGKIDGLVNCAGVYPNTPFLETSIEEWDRVLETNLRGPFLVTQAIAKHMVESRVAGAIVNLSSTASLLARPGIAHYGASKAGLNQLTRVLAVELAPHRIRVNAVLPGVIATETVLTAASDKATEMEAKLQRIPLARLGEPGEVVPMILFLLSDEASYVTGGLYNVDGGFSLGMPRY
jgi:NAD(P)-dependent dehydrogenase (short-subunit alcohol dehydrogenase family)